MADPHGGKSPFRHPDRWGQYAAAKSAGLTCIARKEERFGLDQSAADYKINDLKDDECFKGVVEYMLANNVKLEQENVQLSL